MSAPLTGVIVCHFDEDGFETYHVFGGAEVRLFIVDDRAPHDRVYEVTQRSDPSTLRDLIPEGSVIGHCDDERHEALVARVEATLQGHSHLAIVDEGGADG